MTRLLLAALAGVAAGCTPQPASRAPAASSSASAATLSGIGMDMNSWGRRMSEWTIDAAGNGRYTLGEPNPFDPERMVTRRFAAGAQGFAEVRTMLAGAERYAGGEIPCTVDVTDGAYGQLHWTRAGETVSAHYTQGCGEQAAKDLVAAIERADAIVRGWAMEGTVVDTKPVEK